MATTHGNSGSIDVGGTAIGEVRSFTVNEALDTADDSAMGDTYGTIKTGLIRASGTVDVWFDSTDAGQDLLVFGSEVTLNLYPESNTSGKEKWTVTATITGADLNVDLGAIVGRTVNWVTSGSGITKAVIT